MKLTLPLFFILAASAPCLVYADGNTCVPFAKSVPKDYAPPSWHSTMGGIVDPSLDDPRWNEAQASSFAWETATAPLHVRSIWRDDFLYLSFISDLTPNNTGTRDIFLGFRHTGVVSPPGEQAYIFQFHLEPRTGTDPQPIPACSKWNSAFGCGDAQAKPTYWRVFADLGGTADCGSGSGMFTGRQFKQIVPPASFWLTDNVHSWQQPDGRWAVQIRIKLADAPAQLSAGIDRGALYWYEMTQRASTSLPFSVGKLPSNVGSVCLAPFPGNDQIVHPDLADSARWSNLTLVAKDASLPAGCDKGLYVQRGELGAVFDTGPPYENAMLSNQIKAVRLNNTVAANTLVAIVTNDAATAFGGKLKARFRIADWGATALGTGTWRDVPGQTGSASSVSISASGGRKAMTLNWTLAKQDHCKYGLVVPGTTCEACASCNDAANGCVQVQGQPATCTARATKHQCMHVELSSPNGAVKFMRASAYTNMDFGEMSQFSQEATIDINGVTTSGQEVVIVVVPRNLPSSFVATTGLEWIANRSLSTAQQIVSAHDMTSSSLTPADVRKAFPRRIALNAEKLKLPANIKLKDLGITELLQFEDRRIKLPNSDYELAGRLRDVAVDGLREARKFAGAAGAAPAAKLTRALVSSVGPAVAAKIVPTIEIYAFYRPAKGNVLQSLAAFSVFLSHEGGMSGFKVPDLTGTGLTKIGANMYKLAIPSGRTSAKVTVRSESIDAPLPRDPKDIRLKW